ncbi:MAG TPA: efflux RND transporter permease subunit [Candidatus Saccharimonadales bacterium]|nr:efflux RND transporter permease subunit [Candidatus Saccharimonadales bacterium]
MKRILKKVYPKDGQDRLLPKFSLFIFDRSRTAALLWLCLTVFGIFSYTTLLKREGFPSVNIPFSVISGVYLVNDPQRVDSEVTRPLSEIILKDDRVKTVQAYARDQYYTIAIQYEDEDTNASKAGKEIEQRIKDAGVLPKQATLKMEAPKFGFTERGDDGAISVYSKQKGASQEELVAEANKVTEFIKSKNFADIESISVIDSFVTGTNPVTGQEAKTQTKFDRYAIREGNKNSFYDAATVGFSQKDGTDVIKLNNKLEAAVAEYNSRNKDSGFKAAISATYAHDIEDQISELQRSLTEGLLAVLVIGSIVIAIRASLITVISMLTVLSITLGVLLTIGYSLNTITLFSLVLSLGLIVDDTIIMVEALDAQRRRRKDAREVVKVATKKVSRAMIAATLTAALSFAPLLFVGGLLGNFIRAIPVTVISALLTSLLVALIFIPLFARYLLLGKKQMGSENVDEPAAKLEAKVAAFVGRPMLWARNSTKKLIGVGLAAVLIGFLFVGSGVYIFQKVTFNIFPPSKDSNGLMVTMNFAPGTTIEQAERLADQANKILAEDLGENFKSAAYYTNASSQTAMLAAYLIPYAERDIRAPELEKRLDKKFATFEGARVEAAQIDVGPPAADFTVRIETDDREAAFVLAKDINDFLLKTELKRPNGTKAKVKDATISDPGVFSRDDGNLNITVTARFKDTDTSTLVTLAQKAVEKEYDAKKIEGFGLKKDVLKFDFGQEEENQESFQTLAMAFPLLLLAIYILLAVQFRSLAQPLLIFMAIPFSLFGIALGLYLTDNAFSFFAMLGFFALVGLSIKNTILLTDYANQLRRSGARAVDAAVGALEERFRPLIATSLTAAVSLIPLAITSPFWEGLAVVLIFGLLSSTFLVITVFPYYYLGTEFVRLHVNRKAGLLWLALTIAASFALVSAGASAGLIPLVAIVLAIVVGFLHRAQKRRRTA